MLCRIHCPDARTLSPCAYSIRHQDHAYQLLLFSLSLLFYIHLIFSSQKTPCAPRLTAWYYFILLLWMPYNFRNTNFKTSVSQFTVLKCFQKAKLAIPFLWKSVLENPLLPIIISAWIIFHFSHHYFHSLLLPIFWHFSSLQLRRPIIHVLGLLIKVSVFFFRPWI